MTERGNIASAVNSQTPTGTRALADIVSFCQPFPPAPPLQGAVVCPTRWGGYILPHDAREQYGTPQRGDAPLRCAA